MACCVNDGPMSIESGLSGWPWSVWMAVSSSADEASGLATGASRPYVSRKDFRMPP